MRICFLSLEYPSIKSGGGVGTQVRTLGLALAANGHEVSVIALSEPGEPAFRDDCGVRIHRVKHGNLHWYFSKAPLLGKYFSLSLREIEYSYLVWRQVRLLQADKPFDVIEGTETGALFVALRGKTPLVIRLHGEEYTVRKYTPDLPLSIHVRLSRLLQRMALRRARLLISPSQAHAVEIAAELKEPHPPIEVMPNVIPPGYGADDQAADDESAPMVLYVGRLERGKGILALLEAARYVLDEMPNAQFVLAGAPHPNLPKVTLNESIARLGLEGRLRWLGHVRHEDLRECYRAASVLVLPSYYETFGLAALEAMAFGLPVVAFKSGALPEVIEDGVSGILTTPGDSGALARALLQVLRHPKLRAHFAVNARNRLAKRFEVPSFVRLELSLYEWAIRGPTSETGGAREHVFFSPHWDDVVLSSGGLVQTLVDRGDDVSVVTVFSGDPETNHLSAFARHLSRKWRLADRITARRREEDEDALSVLGVKHREQWDLPEAVYRQTKAGKLAHVTYDDLKSPLTPSDHTAAQKVREALERRLRSDSADATFYFPLSLGGHVDHRLLFFIGAGLCASGLRIRFYEDWPYSEAYSHRAAVPGWVRHGAIVPSKRKAEAALRYTSQIHGLGGSPEELAERLIKRSRAAGHAQTVENYWELLPATAARMEADDPSMAELPMKLDPKEPRLRDFRAFLSGFRWHGLGEVLPPGKGWCLDVGSGNGRYQQVIKTRGYDWVGIDNAARPPEPNLVRADASQLPFKPESAAAVVAWQVLEYVEEPERVFSEASRVLEAGGVLCGSASFLEPLHGRTYFGLSHIELERLLRKYGFSDIEVKPGLSGFALLLWTWLRRWAGPRWARLAIPLSAMLLVPPAAAQFLASYVRLKLGMGDGHGMRWIAERAPLEFAGHLMFVARKASGGRQCT